MNRQSLGGLRELTVKLLEHTVDGAGAASAAHSDVELVSVRHCDGVGISFVCSL